MSTVSVTVLLFASYADAFGRSSMEIALPSGATVNDAVTRITTLDHEAALPPRPAVAVNREYAAYDQPLVSGDEVALIPPVAGG